MPRLTRESEILVGNKELKIEEILKTIIYLPGSQVKSFFTEIGLTIPRELRMFVLRETLREKVIQTRKTRLTLADELNYRLSWFTEFTETQLENLLVFFDDPQLDRVFLEDFWTDLLSYMIDKKVTSNDIKKLLDNSISYVKSVGLELPDMKEYNREIKDLFFDSFGRIDGVPPGKFRPVLYKSSTLGEIRDLGTKYDVNVPRRLKKSELADIIIDELQDRGEHTPELETQIRGMSVLIMQRFAIDHDIKASTELKKEEIIEYILANAKETKESYFVPESPEVYEKEIEEVQKHVEEEPVAKPIFEEKKEHAEVVEDAKIDEPIEEVKTKVEVKDEPKVEVPQKETVQYVQQSLDMSELVHEIKMLREVVEHALQQDGKVEQKDLHAVKKLTESSPTGEPVILNSAEFYGEPKSLKKIIKDDEANEREQFIEDKKAASSIGVDKDNRLINKDEQLPGELRFFGKMFKGLGKFLWKLLKVLFKVFLIAASIAIILFVIYGAITYFVDIPFLAGFNDTLNGIQIAGKGILQHLHDILASIFG
ncbi:hypothetical protein [Peloplasma aerotolerans]|uniref:Rho termination factor N-terminal domain-containing protein n=1 Tax=Peloplasma aerotolerans TaxID=3044389 RepID=A0AAW6U6C3_9MOLU|nr:hypothetical protein [Mariniplasma sp. M4Ah]MDI6452330.1 hypothetical protein [Mariniplasma sp. M4Ah]